ncbi:elongator complex protein [Thraustotheca clavata]|uniref:Elongator complex protein 4 n=1 Tax=Thraustotheca clavata TaxID=74557 RepID=A0A1W0AAW6_9STRA|nr:elongator complex protein [Thraustotheca clavata]
MSSFRRATSASVPSPVQLRGTKAFINNQSLISSGLREMDTLLGGGLLLGSLSVIESSCFGSYCADVLRYFAAEGLASQHVVAADSVVMDSLPLELSIAQKQVKAQMQSSKLTIAWQYEKYNDTNTTSSSRFCHSFDLSKAMATEMKKACHEITYNPSMVYRDVYCQILALINANTDSVVRIALSDVGAPVIYGDVTEVRPLLQFLRAIKGLLHLHRTRLVCMMSVPLYLLPNAAVAQIRHISDYDFEVSSFLGDMQQVPAELQEFTGLFCVHKLARMHSLTCHSLDQVKLGIKRERRKLKLEHLHLPPEGSRSQKQEKPIDLSF